MKNFTIYFVLPFLAYWVAAHLIYAFVMVDFSPFTEWEPISRALNLVLSIYFASMILGLKKDKAL